MPEVQQYVVGRWQQLKYVNFGCHGIPERCLSFRGKKMRICARCLGADIGHVAAFILFILNKLPSLWVALLFIAIMLVDWSLQKFAKIPSTNFRRLLTGFLGGMGVGILIWTAVACLLRFIFFSIFSI